MKSALLVMLLVALAAPAAAQTGVDVTVNGQPVSLDLPPVVQDGRVLVPLRGVFQRLGATVTYDPATHAILAQTPATTVNLVVGADAAVVNGRPVTLETAPITIGARVLVPLRFVSEAMGATVSWNAADNMVAITSAAPPPSVTYAPPPVPLPAPRIARIVLDDGALPPHPLWLGNVLRITMYGTPGGRAEFALNGRAGLPMHENSPGLYQSQYVVRGSDLNRHAAVTCSLALEDGQSVSRTAEDVVVMDGRSGEEEANVAPVHDRLIYMVVHNGAGRLTYGRQLQVRMTGVSGGTAFFDVGNRQGIPMQEVSPGEYLGTYTMGEDDNNPQARVTAHLSLPDGERQSLVSVPSVAEDGWHRF